MVNVKVTIFKSKSLFSKGNFSFFSARFQVVHGELSELAKQPSVDHVNQEGSFLISKDQLVASLESQGFSPGPQTFAGILGEKIALMTALLVAPRPTELDPCPQANIQGSGTLPMRKRLSTLAKPDLSTRAEATPWVRMESPAHSTGLTLNLVPTLISWEFPLPRRAWSLVKL